MAHYNSESKDITLVYVRTFTDVLALPPPPPHPLMHPIVLATHHLIHRLNIDVWLQNIYSHQNSRDRTHSAGQEI